jgi:hypothetical protein
VFLFYFLSFLVMIVLSTDCWITFTRIVQFAALLGDLQHRQDVHLHFGDFGPDFVPFFSSANQTAFVQLHYSNLICDPSWNNHTISTVFEYLYYSKLTFRLYYISLL